MKIFFIGLILAYTFISIPLAVAWLAYFYGDWHEANVNDLVQASVLVYGFAGLFSFLFFCSLCGKGD